MGMHWLQPAALRPPGGAPKRRQLPLRAAGGPRGAGDVAFSPAPMPPCGEEIKARGVSTDRFRGVEFGNMHMHVSATETSKTVSGHRSWGAGGISEQLKEEQKSMRRSLNQKFEEEGEDHDKEMQWRSKDVESERCNWLANVVVSMQFELFCSLVVVLNVISMSIYYDWTVEYAEYESPFFDTLELTFCFWYLLELILRVAPFGLIVFVRKERKWYWFDAGLVVVSLLGVFYPRDTGDVDPLRISKLVKLLRLLRASRMLKLARVMRQSVQFSLLFNLLGSAMGCFFWAVFTAVAGTYTFSLLTLSQVSEFLKQHGDAMNPELKDDIVNNFGSLGRTMLTCFMAVAGGISWSSLLGILHEIGPIAFATFLVYILLANFLFTNLALALFVQSTLKTIYNNDRETLSMHMQRRHRYVETLKEVFGSEWVTWPMYHAEESNPRLRSLLTLLCIERSQARKLFQVLSADGQNAVELHSWVVGCINMKRAVTPLDLMEMELLQNSSIDQQTQIVVSCLKKSGTLQSISNKTNVHDLVTDVAPGEFAQQLFHAARHSARDCSFAGETTLDQFLQTVRGVAELALQADGGCGFVVAPGEAFRWLQEMHTVDFQVVDRSEAYPGGYMTERLRDVNVHDPEFLAAIRELSEHSDNDRWPEGHEAAGLPKDGYILISTDGVRVLCTARMIGLPTPPYMWDGVGTRHMAAVAATHALSRWPCAVVVRSDSGKIHGMCPAQKRSSNINVIGCRIRKG